MKWRIGCDPELFLTDDSGKVIPACGIVPGTKLEPHPVKKGTVQVDGLAAEIGIEPASSAEEFADNVETVLEELKKYTGKLEFSFSPVAYFDEEMFNNLPEESKVLGCDPDFSAYTEMANQMSVPNPVNMRTAAGHIHIGWTEKTDLTDLAHFQDCVAVTKQMDWYLGLPLLNIEDKGMDVKRRSLYGAAGAFRVKTYGSEYRTPSNAWLKDRSYMISVAKNAIKGMDELYKGNHVDEQHKGHAQSLITQHATSRAMDYMTSVRIPAIQRIAALKKAEKKEKGISLKELMAV